MTSRAPQIDYALLAHEPPRPLPPTLLADLVGDRLLAAPLRAYIDLPLVGAILAALMLALLRTPLWLSWALALLVAVRLTMLAWRFLGPALAEAQLLRNGVVVEAQVLRLRSGGVPGEEQRGFYLDCAMPISAARTSVGSVWITNTSAARRLAALGYVRVICLPRAPGTWRLLEGGAAAQRYESSHATNGDAPAGSDQMGE